jgi:6-pyruvoyltetrahydropterin/6-carboxytetrahydropterin synthase
METFRVRVANDELVFSAGHFITFAGGQCERLHGHNYRVAAEVLGSLDENHYVIDFIALRDSMRKILAELDHYVLLPLEHPQIRVAMEGEEVVAKFDNRRWVFPRDNCVLLPLANTTAELLARHIGLRLKEELARQVDTTPLAIRIEVEECCGQSAIWELCHRPR